MMMECKTLYGAYEPIYSYSANMTHHNDVRGEYMFAYISHNNEPHYCFYVDIDTMTVMYSRRYFYGIRNRMMIKKYIWRTFLAKESIQNHNVGMEYMEEKLCGMGITRKKFEEDIARVIGV